MSQPMTCHKPAAKNHSTAELNTLFEGIYRGDRSRLVKHLSHKFGCSMADAEDAFQEVAISLYRKLANLGESETVNAHSYLFKALHYQLRKQTAKKRHEKHCMEHFSSIEASHNTKGKDDERMKLVAWALESMNPKKRQTLELYYLKGYCLEAIATELDYRSAKVAKSSKHRCLAELTKRCRHLSSCTNQSTKKNH